MNSVFCLILKIDIVLDDNSNDNEIFKKFYYQENWNRIVLSSQLSKIFHMFIFENNVWFEVLKMISFFIYE
jgi:hypothetical protein